jgi:hypothetical protein
MSLSDLRKKPASPKPLSCNVDEFIENAQNYAKGLDNVVKLRPMDHSPLQQEPKLPFRKATFTLSEACIEALGNLSDETGLSKSHLVRVLITQMEQSHESQKQLAICRYK